MRNKIYLTLVIAALFAVILYGRFFAQEPGWSVVGSTEFPARVENAGMNLVPTRLLPIEDLQIALDFHTPTRGPFNYHVVITTFRYEDEDRIGVFRGRITPRGSTGGRQTFVNFPELSEELPVEAEVRIEIIASRYHYFVPGWVNCPDVERFTVQMSDGHEVTLDAEEHEFFILHRSSERRLSPPPSIEDIVIEY